MDITPLVPQGQHIIHGYGDGAFTINNTPVSGHVLVTPNQLSSWDINTIETLQPEDFSVLLSLENPIEILLIGTGNTPILLPHNLLKNIKETYSVSIETMDTGAACRTYNILLSEGRNIGAALFAIDSR